jgi:hypothetical protein
MRKEPITEVVWSNRGPFEAQVTFIYDTWGGLLIQKVEMDTRTGGILREIYLTPKELRRLKEFLERIPIEEGGEEE